MDEVAGFECLEPVPGAAWHDVRVARSQHDSGLDSHRPLITVVENQLHIAADDVEELVAIGVDFATVGPGPIDVGDRSDRIPVNSPWRVRPWPP